MSNGVVRFRVYFTLKKEEDGGRRTPIKSGFRTDLEFKEEFRMAVIEFEKEWLFPGEGLEAECNIMLHCNEEIDIVLDKTNMKVVDGANVIGTVRIIEALNADKVNWK